MLRGIGQIGERRRLLPPVGIDVGLDLSSGPVVKQKQSTLTRCIGFEEKSCHVHDQTQFSPEFFFKIKLNSVAHFSMCSSF